MIIPKLQPSKRRREYDSYSDDLRSQVVRKWLFSDKTHRDLDEEVLGLDRENSRGYQSMGLLHFLGLKADFHGIFIGSAKDSAINALRDSDQDFSDIIKFLDTSECVMNIQKLKDQELEDLQNSNRDTPEARAKRIAESEKRPKRIRVYSYTYRRNPDIVVETLLRANGVCESCKQPAPFLRASDGTPFLEVHHIKSLADGGEDTLENVLALCPNCHREKHYGA